MTSWLERSRSLASWKTLTFPIRLPSLARLLGRRARPPRRRASAGAASAVSSAAPPRPLPLRPPRPPPPRPPAAPRSSARLRSASTRSASSARPPRRRGGPTPTLAAAAASRIFSAVLGPMPSIGHEVLVGHLAGCGRGPATPASMSFCAIFSPTPCGSRLRSSSTMRAMRAISASTSWRFSSSLLMSMRQPTSLAARRTFWPFLPMARRELLVLDHDLHDLLLFVEDGDAADLGRGERVHHEGDRVVVPLHDVDLLAAQLADDGLHARALHAHAGAHRVHVLLARDRPPPWRAPPPRARSPGSGRCRRRSRAPPSRRA